jgi:hypothetical protein
VAQEPLKQTQDPAPPEDLPDDPETSYRAEGIGSSDQVIADLLGDLLETRAPLPLADPLRAPRQGGEPDWEEMATAEPLAPRSPADEQTLELRPADALAYKYLGLIGKGGCGEVWEAEQRSLGRTIAIKRLRRPDKPMTEQDLQRRVYLFRQEALAAAFLEHPNIVPVHDLSTDRAGNPLIAMKRVLGRPWIQLIQEEFNSLPPDEFLRRHVAILSQVALAVAFAHSRAIIHRDIKPSQVMVGEFGEVVLMDWGLALILDPESLPPEWQPELSPLPSNLRIALCPAGTPAFMAPEQTLPNPLSLGPWTDVFLLGSTLFYLLSGQTPFKGLNSKLTFMMASTGQRRDLREVAVGRPIPAELTALIEVSMEPDWRKRQVTARQFQQRLQEFVQGENRRRESAAITDGVARELKVHNLGYGEYNDIHGRLEQARTQWPANPALSSLTISLAAGYADRALREQDLALAEMHIKTLPTAHPHRTALLAELKVATNRKARRESQRRIAFGAAMTLSLMAFGLGALAWLQWRRADEQLAISRSKEALATKERDRAEREHYFNGVGLAAAALKEGFPAKANQTLLKGVPERFRGWEWGFFMGKLHADDMRLIDGAVARGEALHHADFAGDRFLTVGHGGGTVTTWDLSTGTEVKRWKYPIRGAWTVDYNPALTRLLITSVDGKALVVDAATGKQLLELVPEPLDKRPIMRGGAFSPDGTSIITTGNTTPVALWDAETGALRWSVPIIEGSYDAAFSPDGTLIVVAAFTPGRCRILRTADGSQVHEFTDPERHVLSADWSPDGRSILLAGTDGRVYVYHADSWELAHEMNLSEVSIRHAVFSGDSTLIAATGADGRVRVWSRETGGLQADLYSAKQMEKVIFHPTQNLLVGTAFNELLIWNLERVLPQPLAPVQINYEVANKMRLPSFPGDRLGVWEDYDTYWLQQDGRHSYRMAGGDELIVDSFYWAYSPDGAKAVQIDEHTFAATVRRGPGSEPATTLLPAGAFFARFNRNGSRLALTDRNGGVQLFDAQTWSRLSTFKASPRKWEVPWCVQFSPTGELLIVGWSSGVLSAHDATDLNTIVWAEEGAHLSRKPIVSLDFSSDGKLLATASSDETARIWEAATGNRVSTLAGHALNVISAKFSADSSLILTVGMDKRAKLWETATGREIATVFESGRGDDLMGASFGRDGRTAYFVTRRGAVHAGMTVPLDVDKGAADPNAAIEKWKRARRVPEMLRLLEPEP